LQLFFFLFFAGEWDCHDGSDEQGIFIMDHFEKHNSKLMNLTKIKEQCYEKYRSNNTPFSNICNISLEYPCFRTGVDDPFNLTLNRPCINLTQIGDGETDCLTGLDERNRLQCPNLGMLGFHFQLDDSDCIQYMDLCTNHSRCTLGVNNVAYATVCFHQEKQFKNGTDSNCNSVKDVMCLNDTCIKGARCNDKNECLYGEDEYRCIPQGKSPLDYRSEKREMRFMPLGLENYPSSIQLLNNDHAYHHNGMDPDFLSIVSARNSLLNLTTKSRAVINVKTIFAMRNSKVPSVYERVRDSLSQGTITFEKHYLPFICNRGVAVEYYTGDTVCLCPPSFYGSQCEFYNDRITVVTHLDLTKYHSSLYQSAVIKVLTIFLFDGQIVDSYEFHVNPQTQTDDNYFKQGIYFLYSRTQQFLDMKRNNRSGTQLYTVQFEAFNLYLNKTIELIGVWQYLIYFDFLPAFRLSKILRFHPTDASLLNSPCLNNFCEKNGVCQEVMNSNRSSYFCSCHSGYYGTRCERYDKECDNYCSPNSLCKPQYRGILTGNRKPFCLCPAWTFGNTCYLKNDNCQKNPCLHGGSCEVTYDLADMNKYSCLCTDSFEGDHC
jgi:hypothetical protein